MANTAKVVRIASCATLAFVLLACSDDTAPAPDTTTKDDAAQRDDGTMTDDAIKEGDAPANADGKAKVDAKQQADGKAKVDARRTRDARARLDTRPRTDGRVRPDTRKRPDATPPTDSLVKPDARSGRSCMSFVSVSGCGLLSTNYTDGRYSSLKRVVRFGGKLGQTYSPKCLRINLGQKVTFKGSFGSHPLTQSCGPATAISGTVRSGISKSFTFTKRGYYGYYCRFHGSQIGNRMAGVIRVGP